MEKKVTTKKDEYVIVDHVYILTEEQMKNLLMKPRKYKEMIIDTIGTINTFLYKLEKYKNDLIKVVDNE